MKNFKENINYFKKWEGMKTLGLGMIIVGILSLWLARNYLMWIGGGALVVVGFALFLWGNMGRASESEIMTEIGRRKDGIEFPEVETERHFQKRIPVRPATLDFEGFEFREGLMFKKMKNGSICSSEYEKARLFMLTDAFYIKKRTFSLVSEDEKDEVHEISFNAVEDIAIESAPATFAFGKKNFPVTVSHLVITYDGGKKLLLPRKNDAEADGLVAKLKKAVANGKTE